MLTPSLPAAPVIPDSLHELIQSLRNALRDELNSRQTPTAGKPLSVPLRDGRLQGRFGRHQRMTFRSPMMPLQGYLHDTQGELMIDGRPHPCVILGLTVDQLTLSLTADLADYIPQARLNIDRMRLLLSLDKRLATIQAHPQDYLTSLAMKCFQPSAQPTVIDPELTLAPDPTLNPEQSDALIRGLLHDISFIWGPPGTGKTMVIGSACQVSYERGARVLIAANTNTAVDQALESVLEKLPEIPSGAVLRLGLSEDDAPEHLKPVTMDALAASPLETLQTTITALKTEEARLTAQIEGATTDLTLVDDLHTLERQYADTLAEIQSARSAHDAHRLHMTRLDAQCTALEQELRTFWEASRWRRLFSRSLTTIQADLFTAQLTRDDHRATLDTVTDRVTQLEHTADDYLTRRRGFIQAHPSLSGNHDVDALRTRTASMQRDLIAIHQRITDCQRQMAAMEAHLVQQARIVATTITRTYTSPLLEHERFDVVIIDEGSMASPPALFATLCLALKQVIIVGDFLQLPSIAEATTRQAQQWLATDIYRLAGISNDQDPRVAALRTQYRMHPDIAAVAARLYQRSGLAYQTDRCTREARQPLVDHAPIPGKAFAFIDTSDEHSWVEKDHRGSPSNAYHASVAIALAKEALSQATTVRPTISIIAPYRNQVRLLQDLVHQAHLTDAVEVGTVHTFQGRQSDIVIFDTTVTGDLTRTMLGRCDSDQAPCKLINVAFTRGKSKLLLIGHGPSLATLANVPDSLLWDAYQLAITTDSLYESQTFVPKTSTPIRRPMAPVPAPTNARPTPPVTQAPLAPVVTLTPKRSPFYLIRST